MPVAPGTEIEISYLFRIDIIGEVHGQITQTSFHFSAYGAMLLNPPISIGSSLLTHFKSLMLPAYMACTSEQWRPITVLCYSMIPKSEVLLEEPATTFGGGQDSVSLPSFVSVCIRLRTGFGGKSRTGSIHLPAVAQDLVTDSKLQDSYLVAYREFRDILLGAYGVQGSSSSFLYGLYSRKLGDTQPGGPGTGIHHSLSGFYPITAMFIDRDVGTIRKRKLGHGE